jgi:hypothetical protein
VLSASTKLGEAPGGHTRITIKALGKKTGYLSILEHHPSDIPLTAATIEQVVETPDRTGQKAFQSRIVLPAAATAHLEGRYASSNGFRVRRASSIDAALIELTQLADAE